MAEGRDRALLLARGFTAEKYWWRQTKWDALKPTLPEWLRLLVAEWQALDCDTRAVRVQLETNHPRTPPACDR
jgi:hypothetical protein